MVKSISDSMNAWFLGPKSENSSLLEDLIISVLHHNVYWRLNYWPTSEPIITEKDKLSELYLENIGRLNEKTLDLVSRLKQGFPFYSPRYLAHMLHDITIPATVGYFAGLLHNANNVTYEASPVTTIIENEVAEDLATLVGYDPKKAWGHITSGGTIANLEALWVARNLKFFPLTAAEVCQELKLDVEIRYGGKTLHLNNPDVDTWCLLNIPVETILELNKSLQEKLQKNELKKAYKEAKKNVKSRGFYWFHDKNNNPIVGKILVPSSRHYSLDKAIDILGIGSENMVKIDVDKDFRMDIKDLEKKIIECNREKEPIIAVVAVLSTTEEGAVDPLDKIIDLRKKLENDIYFFILADAAFGGYARSVFFIPDEYLFDWNQVPGNDSEKLIEYLRQNCEVNWIQTAKIDKINAGSTIKISSENNSLFLKLNEAKTKVDLTIYDRRTYLNAKEEDGKLNIYKPDRFMKRDEINEIIRGKKRFNDSGILEDTKDDIKELQEWPSCSVYKSFEKLPCADSVIIDPHKLGFVPYPAGAVLFQNRHVKEFTECEAPYIFPKETTSAGNNSIEKYVGKFIVEGSKPGAAATACWLTHRCIPLNITGYGAIIGESIRAATMLHSKLETLSNNNKNLYKIVPICKPDLVTVCFIVGPVAKSKCNLDYINKLNENVYKRFSIDYEDRDKIVIYAQKFWLSKTSFIEGHYSWQKNVIPLLEKLGVDLTPQWKINPPESEWELTYLRASVFDPWISTTTPGSKGFLDDFINCLHEVIKEEISKEL